MRPDNSHNLEESLASPSVKPPPYTRDPPYTGNPPNSTPDPPSTSDALSTPDPPFTRDQPHDTLTEVEISNSEPWEKEPKVFATTEKPEVKKNEDLKTSGSCIGVKSKTLS